MGRLTSGGFAALRHRNYRLYLVGQGVSQSGTWMQTIAMGWVVLELTGSGSMLGLVIAVQFTPTLLLGAYAGSLADRRSRWTILQTTQILAASVATILGVMIVTGTLRVWSLFVLAAVFGLVNAFDTPVRSSFVYELVGPRDVTGAVGLGSTMNNIARIIGPAIAGLLITFTDVSWPFFVNGGSYLAATLALAMMRRSEFVPTRPAARGDGVRAGIRIVLSDPALRTPILMTFVIGLLAYENQIVLPLLARFEFAGSAGAYGLMTSALGIGSVIGGLLIARFGRANHLRLGYAALLLGAAILVGAAMPSLPAMLVALVVAGGGSVAFLTMGSATLQLSAPEQVRGRVMALYVTAIIGSTPLGGPLVGWIGETFGARIAYAIGGLGCLVSAALAWRSLRTSEEALRPRRPVSTPA